MEEEGDLFRSPVGELNQPPVAPVMIFQTAGKEKTWGLPQELVDDLTRAFPDVPVLAECDKARAKIETGAVARKTGKGMSRFLWSWMERTQNSARANGKPNAPHQPNSRSFEQRNDYSSLGL